MYTPQTRLSVSNSAETVCEKQRLGDPVREFLIVVELASGHGSLLHKAVGLYVTEHGSSRGEEGDR